MIVGISLAIFAGLGVFYTWLCLSYLPDRLIRPGRNHTPLRQRHVPLQFPPDLDMPHEDMAISTKDGSDAFRLVPAGGFG